MAVVCCPLALAGIDYRGVTGERLPCANGIDLSLLADVILLRFHTATLLLSRVVFQVVPPSLNRVPLRTGERSADKAHVRGAHEPMGLLKATMVQEPEM